MTQHSPDEGVVETGVIRSRGPISGVTVHAHMRSGPHALTEYPLDLTLVVEMMFLFAEQARRGPGEEPLVVTPKSMLERLRALEVRSGNGSRLVGRDAVYESFARIRAKGYIRRINLRADGKAAGVAYEFYDFPAWNPEPFDPASPQVRATSGNAGSGNAGSRSATASPQVRATSGNAGSGNAGSRSATASPQVRATSGNAGNPPLPPGGGTTPPPTPSMPADGARSHPSHAEEGEGVFDEKDLAAASAFLQQLPDPWVIGEQDAAEIAPELLERMAAQGWPSVHTVDRRQLTACIAVNPGGMTNPARIVRRKRVPNLPAFSRVAARAVPSARRSQPPVDPTSIECDKGCDRGYLELEDGVAPCSCLPLRQAAGI